MNSLAVSHPNDAKQRDTIAYYDRNAEAYADATLAVDMEDIYERFLAHLPHDAVILDAGSGAGRDTLAFVKRGFAVDAFDASAELCAISSALTGVDTEVLRFQDYKRGAQYDGIWACASLLHVTVQELPGVLQRLWKSLRDGGAFYLSFKHGAAERVADDGRFFQDLDESTLRKLVSDLDGARIGELWVSSGEGTQKGRAEWLNAILLKDEGREA